MLGPWHTLPLKQAPLSHTHTRTQLKWNFPDSLALFHSLSLFSSLSFPDPMSCRATREKGNAARTGTFEWGCCCKAAGNVE